MSRFVAAAALGLLVIAPTAMAVDSGPPPGDERLLQRVEHDISSGHGARAAQKLARALRSGSTSAKIALRYAELALPCAPATPLTTRSLRHAAMIAESAARAQRREDAHDDAVRQLSLEASWALAVLDRFDESLAAARAAGRRDDALTRACLHRIAALATSRDRLDQALSALDLARGFAPLDPDLARDAGLVLLALGRPHAALVPLFEHLAASPRDLDARRDVAYALLAAGRSSDALELLKRDEQRCRADTGCLLELARTTLEAGLAQDAADLASELCAREPRRLDGLFLLAEAHTKLRAFDTAREDYRRVLALAPNNARAQQALAALAVEPGG